MSNTKYYVVKEKGKVICLITTKRGTFRGIAKLNPEDQWRENTGLAVATLKAEINQLRERQMRYNKKISQLEKEKVYFTGLSESITDQITLKSKAIKYVSEGAK